MKVTMFYDGHCTLCWHEAMALQQKNPEQIQICSLHDNLDYLNQCGISYEQAMTCLYVQDENGQWYQGMQSVRLLYGLANMKYQAILSMFLFKSFFDWLYPYFAQNRYRMPKLFIRWWYAHLYDVQIDGQCMNGQCHLPHLSRQIF
ncbi:thiol-disulfide oxidoreductase DCC family protein [Moraxella sp. ZY210820]|uniref:thiol-disulfide oxidoreductase DCC family protein n=1 Tax=unclassified Moraxella TaxID=2685852 RepID=UPI0027310D6E|nr:DUF393 domain-containing protein [Moraxella sp. ZY210820]WLF83640.1 DUF393 domain-containing protein [Moraxella sp. ZY210820]